MSKKLKKNMFFVNVNSIEINSNAFIHTHSRTVNVSKAMFVYKKALRGLANSFPVDLLCGHFFKEHQTKELLIHKTTSRAHELSVSKFPAMPRNHREDTANPTVI